MKINPVSMLEKQLVKIYEIYASFIRNIENYLSNDEVNTAYDEYVMVVKHDGC